LNAILKSLNRDRIVYHALRIRLPVQYVRQAKNVKL